MAPHNDKNKRPHARKKRAYLKPAVTKHGALNSQIASFRTFY